MKAEKKEITLKGAPASPGVAIGTVFLYRKKQLPVRAKKIEKTRVENHIECFEKACKVVGEDLESLQEKGLTDDVTEIISAQIQILNDPELHAKVRRLIEEDLFSVDYAVYSVFEDYLSLLKNSTENTILKERSVDIVDIRDRLIQFSTSNKKKLNIKPEMVVVAAELSARDVIELADSEIQGLVMDAGGSSSHAAIIARAVGLPAVVGTRQTAKLANSEDTVIVDGNQGVVILNPKPETNRQYHQKLEHFDEHEKELQEVLHLPSVTQDHHPFVLRANIEFKEELPLLKKYRAQGVGLLRTESVYLQKEYFNDRKMQINFYDYVLSAVEDQPVTIRLFDAGGDKFFGLGQKEHNPFLGWRGIRMLLDEREMLLSQLEAILTVAGRYPGRIRLLVPMVTTIEEVLEVKEAVSCIQSRLEREGMPTDEDLAFGIMVEIPAVAIQAPHFAKHVDFFSIGSNDLAQYTLAADRGNEYISHLYRQEHPAVWKLIHQTCLAAEDAGIPVSICGELASYPKAAACLLGMGIDELSMCSASIPNVKKELRSHSMKELRQLTKKVLSAESATEVEELFKTWGNQTVEL